MQKVFTILLLLIYFSAGASTVTGLTGFYRKGQVFLTWQNVSNQNTFYKVYRSVSPITSSSQLASCEYIGYTNANSSKDHNLSQQDLSNRFLHIDSAGLPLSSTTGLFVATTLLNGNYYYAVTTLLNGNEDQTINSGGNVLTLPLSEIVAVPVPVFQETRIINGVSVDIYTNFFSTKYAIDSSLMNKAGFLAFDFGLFRNFPDGSKQPLRFRFHAGGEAFLDNVTSVTVYAHEVNISCEEKLPSGQRTGYWGANENYDVYDSLKNNKAQTSGVNYNFVQLVIKRTVDWAKKYLPVDTNRVYLEGSSLGAIGSYFFALNYPESFAAIKLTAGVFDFGFANDYQPTCSLNPGRKNRKEGDRRLGAIETNLPTSLGIKTYDLFDGGSTINKYSQKEFPFVYSLNGKKDKITGWTEKPIYYDSLNKSGRGGYFFWDEGDHGGNGGSWNSEIFDLFRYSKKISYPAFSDCSLNEDAGAGNDTTGAPYGSKNGMLDWKNETVDEAFKWEAKIFIRDLELIDSSVIPYPDSGTVTLTPRRVNYFFPPPGTNVNWSVKHHDIVVQSGSIVSGSGSLNISGVKIFKDTSFVQLSYGTVFFRDADNDGYGNAAVTITAISQPAGYVANDDDCNDSTAGINPAATEVCNNLDDDCDGVVDENSTVVAVITPSGSISACKSDKVKMTATTAVGYLYQWKKDNVVLAGATKSSYTSSGNESGSYTVVVSDAGGCSATSQPTILTRLSKPPATVTPLGDLNICNTGSVVLQANSGAGFTYKWLFNNKKIHGASNQTYTATETGNYAVKVTNADGCVKKSSAVTVFSTCKSMDESGTQSLVVETYPNPSNGTFIVHFSELAIETEIKLVIKNVIGQAIYSTDFTSEDNEQRISLPATTSPGIYLLEVRVGEKSYAKLIMKGAE